MIKFKYELSQAIANCIRNGYTLRQLDEKTMQVFLARDLPGNETYEYVWLNAQGMIIDSGIDAAY